MKKSIRKYPSSYTKASKDIKCANKFTNKATQLAGMVYTPKQIIKNSMKQHKGEPMYQVFMNIMHDPHVNFGEADKHGNFTMFYDDKNIGWINPQRFMGWIDDKAYQKIEKFDMSQLEDPELDGLGLDDTHYAGADEDFYDKEYSDDEDEDGLNY